MARKGRRNTPSSIDRLPPEVKELIGRLRADGRTLDEILAKLHELDAEISRSALGRHVKKLADVAAQLRQSREIATSLATQFGDEPDNRLARLNLEFMHGAILRLVTATAEGEDGEVQPVTFNPEEVMFLSRSMQALAGAEKSNMERTLKLKAEFAKEAVKKLDTAVATGQADAEAMERAKRILFG